MTKKKKIKLFFGFIVAVGLLSKIAIAIFIRYQNRVHTIEVSAELQELKVAEEDYFVEHNKYSDNLKDINFSPWPQYVKVEIISADEKCFKARGRHTEFEGYWSIDCNGLPQHFYKPDKKAETLPSPSFTDSESGVVGRDSNFIAYANGVVYDKNTNLEWVGGPDNGTNWNEAKRWVENLAVAGSGWRMPTKKELKTLYKKGAGSRNMTPLLKTTGWWIWSGETEGTSMDWAFQFYGSGEFWNSRDRTKYFRGFAVRTRK